MALVAAAPALAAGANPTPAQIAGQRVVWPVDGTGVSASMRRAISRGEVGSVIVFGRNAATPAALARLVRGLQAVPRPPALDQPLLVMIDQEGGLVKRLPSLPPGMSARRMGTTLTTHAIRSAGAATGRGLGRLGVNVDLAPVCDVATPRGDIARDQRAFGTSPGPVGADCAAFAAGLQSGGVAAAAKHFPGFGRARVNTDDAPVRITATRAEVLRDVGPFRAAIAAGTRLVLVASAIYPAFGPRPAGLSRQIAVDLLRHDVGFRGVSVTDALDAPALKPWGGTRGAAGAAAIAGMDLVLVAGSEAAGAQAARGVARALADGSLSRSAASTSLRRVLALRSTLGG